MLQAVNDFWGVAPCIFTSFNNAVSNTDYIVSSDLTIVNGHSQDMKGSCGELIKVIFWHMCRN
jgi:hypothetical protein